MQAIHIRPSAPVESNSHVPEIKSSAASRDVA